MQSYALINNVPALTYTRTRFVVGILSSVSNLSAFSTPDAIIFTWFAPYSLDEVPIFGYTASVLVTSQLNSFVIVNDSAAIANTTTNFTVSKTDDLMCALVTISVYPHNAIGTGERSDCSTYFVDGKECV